MVIPCFEVAMSDAERESEARCLAMLNKLVSKVKKQTMEMEDLAVRMNEIAVGLKAITQPQEAPVHALPPSGTALTATLVAAVDHAMAAPTPGAEAAHAPESPTKCSTSGPDPNAGYAKVAAMSLLPRGATTAFRAHTELVHVPSLKSFDTRELSTVTPTMCSTACHSCNIDVAITGPEPSDATNLVRDGTCVLTSTPSSATLHSIDLGDKHVLKLCCCQLGVRKLFDEMPIRSTVVLWPPPMKWDERQLWLLPSRVVIKCSGGGLRPTPWPSFACNQVGLQLKTPWPSLKCYWSGVPLDSTSDNCVDALTYAPGGKYSNQSLEYASYGMVAELNQGVAVHILEESLVKMVGANEKAVCRVDYRFVLVGECPLRTNGYCKDMMFNGAMASRYALKLDALVIIGGVTSNTDAAQLAATFAEAKSATKVVGVPVTLNGDLKNQFVEKTVGFDTICKMNSQLISNVCTDDILAEKYYYFILLMGRKASHVSLECTLQSHPNMVILGEEVDVSKLTIFYITKQICDTVQARAEKDKYHGGVLIPKGLVESISKLYALLQEIHGLHGNRVPQEFHGEENMLTCLADLISQICNQKKKTGVIAPKCFIQRLKKQNELFRSYMHQHAHEFLNFLLNELDDIFEKESNAVREALQNSSLQKNSNGPINGQPHGSHKEPVATLVHKCFQGILTNETRCSRGETIIDRDETFFDLSLDIEQNSSITSCLKNFSSTETWNAEDKFFCDKCCSLQEAQKRMKIKKPPNILVIHLKRFKYIEQLGHYKKLSYRVVFPLELKLINTVDNSDLEYSLFDVLVHVGKVPLLFTLSPRIISNVAKFKPDIIHASSPGIMVFGALVIAKLLSVPLVMSYHTHVPVYIPKYTFSWLVEPMWQVIRFLHRAADLNLVPSAAISNEFETAQVISANIICLWNKGVDSANFHPRVRSHEMRVRLRVMDRLPGVRIAFIGDGPYRPELEKMFEGMPAVFAGMMQGEELSQAYASGEVFVMPSELGILGQVVESMSAGDWVWLREEDTKRSQVGMFHSIDRNGAVYVGLIGMDTLWKGEYSDLACCKISSRSSIAGSVTVSSGEFKLLASQFRIRSTYGSGDAVQRLQEQMNLYFDHRSECLTFLVWRRSITIFFILPSMQLQPIRSPQGVEAYCVGQFVRLKANISSPLFEWQRKRDPSQFRWFRHIGLGTSRISRREECHSPAWLGWASSLGCGPGGKWGWRLNYKGM